jgi:hypothetical protein
VQAQEEEQVQNYEEEEDLVFTLVHFLTLPLLLLTPPPTQLSNDILQVPIPGCN